MKKGEKMNPETHLDFTRHPIKRGKWLERADNPKEEISLPEEGLRQAQQRAHEFAEEFESAPEGTVFWALTSDADRTQEARYIFDQELSALEDSVDNLRVVDLDGKMPDDPELEAFMRGLANEPEKSKAVFVNGPVHEALTNYSWNSDEFNALIDELGSEEELLARWQEDPEVGKRLGVPFEKMAGGYRDLLEEIVEINENLFPGREVWVRAFGHSGRIEVGLSALSGRSVREVLEEAGGNLIETLESAHVVVRPDGDISVEYRGKKL